MRYLGIGFIWLAIALIVGGAGLLRAVPPPGPQLLLTVLTLLLLVASGLVSGFREWLASLGWRPLVALHLVRFIGFYFLVLYARGELPFAFAVPDGIGDIVIAVLALVLLADHRRVSARPVLLLSWNGLGLTDILFVVTTAARLGMADPDSMAAIQQLPLSLLPTFFVPLIIASHVWIFSTLWAGRRGD